MKFISTSSIWFLFALRSKQTSSNDRAQPLSLRALLVLYCLAVFATGLVLSLAAPAGLDWRLLGGACACQLLTVVAPFLRMFDNKWHWIFRISTVSALFLAVYTALHTGGIRSPAVIWLCLLVLPIFLLWGGRRALKWFGLQVGLLAFLALSNHWGWAKTQVDLGPTGGVWTWLNHAMALADLMVIMHVYDHMHTLKKTKLERGNVALKAMHRALETARMQKDEFVAAVGHELRTPMNAILGFNNLLRKELQDHPEQLQAIEHIGRSTEHLLYVVNEILEFSQLQAGQVQLHLEDADVHAVLKQALTQREGLAHDKGLVCVLDIEARLPRWFHLDRQRLLQVLGVLLDNAIKFTNAGEIRLEACLTDSGLRCTVRDTGPGIAVALQAQIFKRLERDGASTTRRSGSTGLGLTIGERLIALQGGTMGVRSLQGRGAVFWFELPAQAVPEPEQAVPIAPDAAAPYQPSRILVVDDNAVNLIVAKMQLKLIWPLAQVVAVNSGLEALAQAQKQVFDVALIDAAMPNMSGPQLAQQLKLLFEQGQVQPFALLGLTASTQPEERRQCLEAGMRDVLHKPLDGQRIKDCVALHVHAPKWPKEAL